MSTFNVTIRFPTPGATVPGGGGFFAWGVTDSAYPLTSWSGSITGGGTVDSVLAPCLPNTWSLRVSNASVGSNVTLTVNVIDSHANTGTANVTLQGGAR